MSVCYGMAEVPAGFVVLSIEVLSARVVDSGPRPG
jgi:hypothetical protein